MKYLIGRRTYLSPPRVGRVAVIENKKEVWKSIKGFKKQYQVSNLGRVKSIKKGRETLLKPQDNGNGYKKQTLWLDGVEHQRYVHILVLETFKGKRPTKYHACHLDGKRSNNKLSNLKWASQKENQAHRELHGTGRLGKKRKTKKYSKEIADSFRKEFKKTNLSMSAFARLKSIPRATMTDILMYRVWR